MGCATSACWSRSRKNFCDSDSSDPKIGLDSYSGSSTPAPRSCFIQRFAVLFEDEQQSDVVLLVGEGAARERIPAHSWVVAHSNDYFRSVLPSVASPSASSACTGPKRELHFPHDQPKSFRNFIGWLYGRGYSPKTTEGALDTLQVAIKYFALDLVEHIVNYLIQNIHPENVLQIMAWGHQCSLNTTTPPYVSQNSSGRDFTPSAPPAGDLSDELPPPYPGTAPPPSYDAIYDNAERDPSMVCRHLVTQCFSVLDSMADEVLLSEAVEEVTAPLLSAVLSRDSLGVASEISVVQALIKWSSAECRRQHLPLDMEGRRRVLGQMLTLPRLLTLDVGQLDALGKLYTKTEVKYIAAVIRKSAEVPPVPPMFVGCFEQMSRRRKSPKDPKQNKEKKDKQKGSSKKGYSTKQLMWDIFSIFAHMID